jgi:hypothetical protein
MLQRAREALDLPEDTPTDDVIGAVNTELEEFPDDSLKDVFWKHAERGRDIIHETATGPYVDTDAVASTVDPLTFVP